jgi:hypothetical protein
MNQTNAQSTAIAKKDNRLSFVILAVKVFVLVLPAEIASEVFRAHSKLAWGIGLFLGAIASYCIPPRGGTKILLILLAVCLVLGVARFLIP